MASRLTTFIVATIVAGTLIAGLIVGAQRDDATGPVDLIITNGQVYTGAGTQFAEAVAVRGNKVLVVGSNREVKRLRRPRTTMVDAHGGTVLPGFNDAHVHLLDGGRMLTAVDLFGASTLADVEAALKAYAALHADEPWIRGRRWTYQPLPGSVLARQRLDAIVPDRPALVTAADNRAGWANTRALQAAGITRRTPNPPDGVIVKDPRTGDPTGVLKGGALRLVERVLPEPTDEERRTAVRTAAAEAHSVGITSVQHVAGDVDDLKAVAALRTAGELDLRVYAGLAVAPGFTEADAEALDAARTSYPDDPLFKAGAVAVTVGAVETGPFAGRARRVPTYTAAELTSLVRLLDARGWQIVVRTHDRHGVRMALDAFEQAMGATPTPERGRRHRLEHVTGIDDADVDRLVQMGIVAAQRPTPGGLGAGDLDAWAARGATSRTRRVPCTSASGMVVDVSCSAAAGRWRFSIRSSACRRCDGGDRRGGRRSHTRGPTRCPGGGGGRLHDAGSMGRVRRAAEGTARTRHARRHRHPLDRHLHARQESARRLRAHDHLRRPGRLQAAGAGDHRLGRGLRPATIRADVGGAGAAETLVAGRGRSARSPARDRPRRWSTSRGGPPRGAPARRSPSRPARPRRRASPSR
jgi:predicted amidohydrolase YtcJ